MKSDVLNKICFFPDQRTNKNISRTNQEQINKSKYVCWRWEKVNGGK